MTQKCAKNVNPAKIEDMTNINTQFVAMLALAGGLLFGALPAHAASLSLGATSELAAKNNTLTQGEEVVVVVQISGQNEQVTGVESYLQYDPEIFERVGSGNYCDSSEYTEVSSGQWFIESCLAKDETKDGKTYFAVSKSIALKEDGYGTINGTENVLGMRLRVKDSAQAGATELNLSGDFPRISKIFISGDQHDQPSSTLGLTIAGTPTQTQEEDEDEDDDDDKKKSEKKEETVTNSDGSQDVVAFSDTDSAEVAGVFVAENAEEVFQELEEFQKEQNAEKTDENNIDQGADSSLSLKNALKISVIIATVVVIALIFYRLLRRNKNKE